MPSPPRVSVCTISHNRRPLLPLLQSCLLAQEYPLERLEWVIVDDSTTGARPDLEPARRAGITVVWQELSERLAIGAKRNLANDLASGELIVVMDDDDYYPPSRIAHAVERLLSSGAQVAGCDRLPLLLLPEQSCWLTPPYSDRIATANGLAYRRSFLEAGHRFDPAATVAEEPAFLAAPDGTLQPLLQLDPFRTLVCISHGGNTVDKRTWMAAQAGQGFERLPDQGPGFPNPDWLEGYRAALGLPAAAASPDPGGGGAGTASQPRPWRVAVITPYRQEPLEILRRCHASVLAQTVPCVHVLVADGPQRPEVAALAGRHLVLGVSHDDCGNTTRSIGALAAMNEGFDCIAFLDAEHWFRPEHLEVAIATQAERDVAAVFSDRWIVFPNGLRLLTPPAEELDRRCVDASCMVLFPPAFALLALWAELPRAYGPLSSQLMFRQLMARHRCGWSGHATLVVTTWQMEHFLAGGLVPPLTADFLRRRPQAEWEEAAEAFRRRSSTPVHPGPLPIAPSKPRLNLITILAGPGAGGELLQWQLCRHFGFRGIRDNQFLFQWRQHLDADPQRRLAAAQITAALAERLPIEGLAAMLHPDRHYSAIEAYFRVILALTTAETRQFSLDHGAVTVLDRSSSLPLAADLLWASLPRHQALLVLRDPIEQLAAWQRRPPAPHAGWPSPQAPLVQRLQAWLGSLLSPLQAAPPGQIQRLCHRELVEQPQRVVARVSGLLGRRVNGAGALEPLPELEHLVLDRRRFEDLEDRWQGLVAELGIGAPWPPAEPDGDNGAGLHPEERRSLELLLAPLRPWWESEPSASAARRNPVERSREAMRASSSGGLEHRWQRLVAELEALQPLVSRLAAELQRHFPLVP